MTSTLVCSWNVHECVGADGRRDPARVASVLEEIGADVVALQEIHSDAGRGGEEDQARFLTTSSGLQDVYGPTLERRGGRYGNLVLSRLAVEHVARHDLSMRGREPRGALEVTLASGDGSLRVVATHLGLRAAERVAQARLLLDRVRPAGPGEVLLLLGDFNEWRPWGRPLALLRERFGAGPAPRTFPARRPILALDRIWVAPRERLEGLAVHRSPRAVAASDHLPLVARLGAKTTTGR